MSARETRTDTGPRPSLGAAALTLVVVGLFGAAVPPSRPKPGLSSAGLALEISVLPLLALGLLLAALSLAFAWGRKEHLANASILGSLTCLNLAGGLATWFGLETIGLMVAVPTLPLLAWLYGGVWSKRATP